MNFFLFFYFLFFYFFILFYFIFNIGSDFDTYFVLTSKDEAGIPKILEERSDEDPFFFTFQKIFLFIFYLIYFKNF